MKICEFDERQHLDGVRECLIELQDAERRLDPRMPAGAQIVDRYIPQMLEHCVECDGAIFVAIEGGKVVGYTTILASIRNDELESGVLEYGLVADLVVSEGFRGNGIGGELLRTAENYARTYGVRFLRIGSLAMNQTARQLYESQGYATFYVEVEKDLAQTQTTHAD